MTSLGEWVGIDVAKANLDVFSKSLGRFRVANSDDGHGQLTGRLAKIEVDGIVIEATGGYEQKLLRALAAHDIPASLVNPARVRAFAVGTDQLGKTDRIDAEILSSYGAYKKPKAFIVPTEDRVLLKQLLDYRSQIVEEIVARHNQLALYTPGWVRERAVSALEDLKAERDTLETQIKIQVAASEKLTETYRIISSMPSVGIIVGATLLAELPELGLLSRRKIASLAGLAPFPRDSGTKKGYRAIKGGRAVVRRALYIAARVAIRHNPPLKAFFKRLMEEKKKPFKVAIVAVMRKLLTILNVMVATRQTWRRQRLIETAQSIGSAPAEHPSVPAATLERRRAQGRSRAALAAEGLPLTGPSTVARLPLTGPR